MAVVEITSADVKGILGIGVTSYDNQLESIVAAWNEAIESELIPALLNTAALGSVIFLGKLMVIAGWAMKLLPAGAITSTSTRTVVRAGSLARETQSGTASQTQARSPGDAMIADGWGILSPFKVGGDVPYSNANQFMNTTGQTCNYFTLRDDEGHITDGFE